MNYQLGGTHSVILMSVRANAPYADRFDDNGYTIIYEGHDVPRSTQNPDPKIVDQPQYTPFGSLTENGKFYQAALEYKKNKRPLNESEYMRKSNLGYGHTMAFFI